MKNSTQNKKILHCDMNNFFASVELLSFPNLKDKPVAVCGVPSKRHGIILAKNNKAKAFGVVTAETIWSAQKKCPDLILLPPHYEEYIKYSKLINEIYYRYTDLIEPFSIDESWLDVSGSTKLFGDAKKIADDIRNTVKKELGLTLSAGVSFNKIFAKMASEYKKPDATTVISEENFKQILWQMPAEELFFVGKATSKKLFDLGILTIGDLAVANRNEIFSKLGKNGLLLIDYANGSGATEVTPFSKNYMPKSISHGMTFEKDLFRFDEVKASLRTLSDMVAFRLRRKALFANTLKLEIKDPNFQTSSHRRKLPFSTNTTDDIYQNAILLYNEFPKRPTKVRLFAITAGDLTKEKDDIQLSIFDDFPKENEKSQNLDIAMDSIRNKYGKSLIKYASAIKNAKFK